MTKKATSKPLALFTVKPYVVLHGNPKKATPKIQGEKRLLKNNPLNIYIYILAVTTNFAIITET